MGLTLEFMSDVDILTRFYSNDTSLGVFKYRIKYYTHNTH